MRENKNKAEYELADSEFAGHARELGCERRRVISLGIDTPDTSIGLQEREDKARASFTAGAINRDRCCFLSNRRRNEEQEIERTAKVREPIPTRRSLISRSARSDGRVLGSRFL